MSACNNPLPDCTDFIATNYAHTNIVDTNTHNGEAKTPTQTHTHIACAVHILDSIERTHAYTHKNL